jgi:hypothetical protein
MREHERERVSAGQGPRCRCGPVAVARQQRSALLYVPLSESDYGNVSLP